MPANREYSPRGLDKRGLAPMSKPAELMSQQELESYLRAQPTCCEVS